MTEPRLFSTKEVSILLQVSRQAVAMWARGGLIRHGKTPGDGHYRFRLKDINAARVRQGLPPLTEGEAVLLLDKAS